MARRFSLLFVVLLVLTACGNQSSTELPPPGERVPITSRAIASVMLDHLSAKTSRREATYVDEQSPPGYVGADFRYHGGGESDGDLVRVTLQRGGAVPACRDGVRCAALGRGVTLYWERQVPEEDPGYYAVTLKREGTLTVALVSGPRISADPRKAHPDPSVEALADLVRDERLRLRTSPQAVAAGEQVSHWEGGERAAGELDEVPNDDQTVVTGFVFGWDHQWRYVGPSPVKDLFGEGAIGGRAQVSAELEPVGPGTIDALAAPQPPRWLTRCLDGYTCWSRGAVHFAWRPAHGSDPGDAFLVHVSASGETAALHTVGRRLPAARKAAMGLSGYFMWGTDFTADDNVLRVGLTTTRERFEQAKRTAHG